MAAGEIGAAKTSLLCISLQQLDPSAFEVIQIAGAHVTTETLLDMLLIALGVPKSADPAK